MRVCGAPDFSVHVFFHFLIWRVGSQFTLETNKMPPQLPVLFDDMFSQPGLTEDAISRITASSANVLTFQYFNGEDATILVSKTAGRYRVQSGNLQALWMVSSDLVRRLKDYYASGDGKDGDDEPFQIAYQEPLPLADFFACIDDHFGARKALADANAELNDRAHQFRLIQKRLLVRFKERNPSPLANLDMLLHGTYNQLIELGGQVRACTRWRFVCGGVDAIDCDVCACCYGACLRWNAVRTP